MVRVIWFHCFLSLCLAPFYGTWLLAVLAGGGMTCLATLLYKNASGALTTRLSLAAIFMGMSALIIQQSHGTIEAHFGIFVLLAFLLYYRDWRPIVTAAGVIAVHHILFFVLQQVDLPIYVFNHHHGFLMVLVHAGYVVFETIILVIMAELARKEAMEAQEVAAFSTRVHSDGTINIRVDNATTTGQTSQNLRQLLSVIDSAVTRARSAADGIDQTSAHLSEIADQIRTSGGEQEQGTGQVATAAEQMSGIFASVARETSETADAARASEQEAVGGKEIVRRAVAEMESLASEVETAVHALEKLQEQSTQIGGIAKLIDGIAGQTNMLALNATIEAGRAGEAGRGFAIVADEVRALSKNTQTSVSKIDQMVQAVRLEISNVKQVLENCSARTVSALAQTKTADKAFIDIVSRTGQITQRAQKVAGSVEEQGSATAEVTRGIKAIEKIARHNTAEAERLLETISTLEGLSRELNSSVDRFLTSDGVGNELTQSHPVAQYAEELEPVMHFAE